MKKKKIIKQGIRGDIVLIFILSIIGILLLFGIIFDIILPNILEPHFKITKEECWNETSKNIIVEIDSFCGHIAKDSQSYEIDNYKTIKDSCKDNFYVLVKELDYLQIIIEYPYEFIIEIKEVCEQVEVDDNIIDWCYSKYNCGQILIGTTYGVEIEWLEENCECIQIDCEYVFNASKKEKFKVEDAEKFIAKTYEGIIWEGNFYQGDAELIERCNPCQKYKCGNYFVETWNQIK